MKQVYFIHRYIYKGSDSTEIIKNMESECIDSMSFNTAVCLNPAEF